MTRAMRGIDTFCCEECLSAGYVVADASGQVEQAMRYMAMWIDVEGG